jgi:hypothetical protein
LLIVCNRINLLVTVLATFTVIFSLSMLMLHKRR